jgi:UDP-2-acetamido-2,6-beta-L-arabino-hexul-4-ose reductase
VRVLITGSTGFVGRNLGLRLAELPVHQVLTFDREDDPTAIEERVAQADFVVHLAGVNRPQDPAAYLTGNAGLTERVCNAISSTKRRIPILFASSRQAELDNAYGRSKLAAENSVRHLWEEHGSPAIIYRLPNLFGKWCRPNYNSVVATFCHNLARDLPVRVDDPRTILRLAYVDDVVEDFLGALRTPGAGVTRREVAPVYEVSLGELLGLIESFKEGRQSLMVERVGAGFVRALYSTYVSYLPVDRFAYSLPSHSDLRGTFVEMLKTRDSGQFSYFTAHPGVTRGGHYHHSKTEKFLVITGRARFRFRNLLTDEYHEIITSGGTPQVVETIPGWTHDITNIGDVEMVVMLWANEVFDRERPDTYARAL